MMHFLVPHFGFGGGMLITGGHQAAGWNALIPLTADGSYFDALRQRELFDLYHGRRFRSAAAAGVHPFESMEPAMLEAYWGYLVETLDVSAIAAAEFRVVGDFCNGSGAAHARTFAARLGLDLVSVNDVPSGVLPRDPEPRPRSESPIRSIIAPLGATAGLVFNSDLSRMGVVSDTGEPLSEELTFPLLLDYVLELPRGDEYLQFPHG